MGYAERVPLNPKHKCSARLHNPANKQAVTGALAHPPTRPPLQFQPTDVDSNVPTSLPILPDARTGFPKIAVIGKVTADAAYEHGLPVDYCPDNYVAEEFIAQFPGYPDLRHTNILWQGPILAAIILPTN